MEQPSGCPHQDIIVSVVLSGSNKYVAPAWWQYSKIAHSGPPHGPIRCSTSEPPGFFPGGILLNSDN